MTGAPSASPAAGRAGGPTGGPAVVDVHAHAMPMEVLEWLAAQGRADLGRLGENIVVIDPEVSGVGSGAPLPCPPPMYDVAARLAQMDEAGVSHQAVSVPPFLWASMSTDEALVTALVRRDNEALAGLVAGGGGRLMALGAVPVGFAGAAEEALRCLDELGMHGLAIGSRGGGRDLDDPDNEDLWALCAERQTFVFLHPSGVPDPPRMKDFWFPQLLGYPMETALSVARLVFSGVTERHPFPLCLAHGGGCLGSVRGRLDMGWDRKPVAHTTTVAPSELFDRLFYDTVVFSEVLLRRLVEDVGAGHVLAGTDYPFDLADRDVVATVQALGLSPSDERAVLAATAARLLGLASGTRPDGK